MPWLHVVIPVYNETDTLETCVRRVFAAPLPEGWRVSAHLIDDHSAEPGRAAAGRVSAQLHAEGLAITLHRHEINRGKGAAVQTGFDAILASPVQDDDLVIIQDADLEYDPADFATLMAPVISGGGGGGGEADAVIGTRWGEHRPLRGFKRRVHALGNRLLTVLSNLMTGYRVSDMECCYKLMPVKLLRRLRPLLTEPRFGIEPQIVAGLARLGARVVERPVHYTPRGFTAGKKITFWDGLRAIGVIVRERTGGRGSDAAPTAGGLLSRNKLLVQALGFLLGLALLIWCIHEAVKKGDWTRLREAPPGLIAGLAACTLVSLLVNGAIFWLVMRPVQRLRLRDMVMLNLATGVLNYAPFRAGLLARIAYNMRIDGMSLLRIGAWFAAVACTLLLVVGACAIATLIRPRFDGVWLVLMLGQVVLGGFLIGPLTSLPVIKRYGAGIDQMLRPAGAPWVFWGAIGLRFLDVAAFAGRMACAAAILNVDLPPDRVFLLAMAAVIVSLNPLGRFGFREWAVAMLAGPLGMTGEGLEGMRAQLALVESAGEAIVAIPLGTLALIWYVRRWRAAGAHSLPLAGGGSGRG